MQACAFISKSLLALLLLTNVAIAEEPSGKTDRPEEDDFKATPYTKFGEFDSDDEDEDMKFFQNGRFFGVSFGGGYQGATGNRGLLYQGGMPVIDVKVHAWFDFNLAMALGVYTVKHDFVGKILTDTSPRRYDVNILRFGFDLRYYFDTKDLSAPITFAGPFLTAGVGMYSRNRTDTEDQSDIQKENSMGLTVGGGLEFVLKPKKTYFNIETKVHIVSFEDTNQPVQLSSGQDIPDTAGMFWSIVGSFLFTW